MLLTYTLFQSKEVEGLLAVFILIVYFGLSFWLCWKTTKSMIQWLKRKSRITNVWLLVLQILLLAITLGGFQGLNYMVPQ